MALRLTAFAALVIFGAMNREMTGILLWLSLFAAYPRKWTWWLPIGCLLAIMLIVLRVAITTEPTTFTPAWVLDANLTAWRTKGAILYQGMLAPLWVLLYHKARGKVVMLIACVLIPYLILFATLGVWQEVRLMMPVFIMGIPLARESFGHDKSHL